MPPTPLDTIAAALEQRGWRVDRTLTGSRGALGRWKLDAAGAGVCYLEYFGSPEEPAMCSVCADPDDSATQMATMLHFGAGWEDKLERFLKGVDRFRA